MAFLLEYTLLWTNTTTLLPLSHLILKTTQWGGCYFLSFTDRSWDTGSLQLCQLQNSDFIPRRVLIPQHLLFTTGPCHYPGRQEKGGAGNEQPRLYDEQCFTFSEDGTNGNLFQTLAHEVKIKKDNYERLVTGVGLHGRLQKQDQLSSTWTWPRGAVREVFSRPVILWLTFKGARLPKLIRNNGPISQGAVNQAGPKEFLWYPGIMKLTPEQLAPDHSPLLRPQEGTVTQPFCPENPGSKDRGWLNFNTSWMHHFKQRSS